MRHFRVLLLLVSSVVMLAQYAHADSALVSTSSPTYANGQVRPLSMDTSGNLRVNASVSASVSGFTPNGSFASLTAAGTSGSVALPTGATVAFQNTGTTTVSCTLGVGSATATANEIQVPASSTVFVTVGSNTFGACIDQSGTTSNTVVLAGGSGLGTGFGGGGGGSSSNASVSATGSAVPGSATYAGLNVSGNLTGWPGTANGGLMDWNTSSQAHADLTSPPTLGSASGGLTVKTLAALSNTAIAVKASAGQVYKVQCYNPDASAKAYIQIFNVAAASVTMGTTAPTEFFGIAAGTNAGFAFSLVGEQYSTAISAGAATTATGGTVPTTALDCTIAYN